MARRLRDNLAAAISLATVLVLVVVQATWLFVAIPAWMLLRMGRNVIDGMLERKHGQKSALGGDRNEAGDVIFGAVLDATFTFIASFMFSRVGRVSRDVNRIRRDVRCRSRQRTTL